MRLPSIIAGALAIAIASHAAPPARSRTLVLIPPANISGSDDAPQIATELLAKRIARRGWSIAPVADVEAMLESERIRYFDSLPAAARTALLERFNASAVVVATVLAFREGSDPAVALSARMVDARGLVTWGNLVALEASEIEGPLGVGRPATAADLAREVAARLMREFPRPGRRGHVEPGIASPTASGPKTYRSATHPYGHRRRVCILPFSSSMPESARVVMEVLTSRLAGSEEFAVIEPSEFREAMRTAGLRSVPSMTSTELSQLGKVLGTMLFLRGNIYTYREGMGGRAEIQFDMNLADVETGEVLWAVSHEGRGLDYAGLLGRGTVNSAVHLADRLISETILAQSRAKLRSPRRKSERQASASSVPKER